MIDKSKSPRCSPLLFCVLIAVGFALCEPGIALAQVSGSGTTGKIPKWAGTTTLTDSVMSESSGIVGIGAPGAAANKLDIFGTTASQLHLSSNGSASGLYLFANGNDGYYLSGASFEGFQWIAKAPNAALFAQASGASIFYSNTDLQVTNPGTSFDPTERMRLTSNGYLGIGTQTPGRLLHIRDEASTVFTGARVSVPVDSSDPVYELLHETANKGFRWRLGNGGISDLYLDYTTNGFASHTPHLSVLNSGNVGIGTITPGSKLEVAGNSMLKTSGPVSFLYDTTGTANARQFYFWNTNGHLIGRWVNDANDTVVSEAITFLNNGNVGIGITNPWLKLNVWGGRAHVASVAEPYALGVGRTDSGAFWLGASSSASPDLIVSNNGGAERVRITDSGRLGVGTASPSTTLHVVGTATITGATSTGTLSVTGNVTATGSIAATYQDVAEWVPSSRAILAGTVVVLDYERSNHVLPSNHPYDSRVAGVVSARPGLILGEAGEGKVMVATTGRVKIKVDASNGPIRVGDLLVTSGKEGIAMKSLPLDLGGTPIHRPGTLIGKALEPLAKGTGEILVLLSLQ